MVHHYKLTSVLLNLPAGTHWTCVALDFRNKQCVQLESLVAGGVLSGKPIQRSWEWLVENESDIGGMILVKKNQPPVEQLEPVDLVLNALWNFKLTAEDVRRCTHSTLMTMMEYRDIWNTFKDLVSSQKYYAVRQVQIKHKVYKPNDKLPYTFRESLNFARDGKISSSDYEQRYNLFPSRVKDVMAKWCDKFEERWHQTGKSPKTKEIKAFKAQMMQLWKKKKEMAIKQTIHFDFTEDSVQGILAAKDLKVIEAFDGGYEVAGAKKTNGEMIKLTTSAAAMNKFSNDGWFEFILPIDTKTRLGFVKPNQTRVQIKTRKIQREHILEKLELITSPTELDKKKAVWFIPRVKKIEEAPQRFFRLSCDPRKGK